VVLPYRLDPESQLAPENTGVAPRTPSGQPRGVVTGSCCQRESALGRRSQLDPLPAQSAAPFHWGSRPGSWASKIRAGVHTVELLESDLAGIGVHIGAGVSSLADAGQVLVTSTVRDLVAASGIEFEDSGVHSLKGVPDAWRLYAVRQALIRRRRGTLDCACQSARHASGADLEVSS
jgi:class 3 adenylate cyclase